MNVLTDDSLVKPRMLVAQKSVPTSQACIVDQVSYRQTSKVRRRQSRTRVVRPRVRPSEMRKLRELFGGRENDDRTSRPASKTDATMQRKDNYPAVQQLTSISFDMIIISVALVQCNEDTPNMAEPPRRNEPSPATTHRLLR